VLVAHAQKIEIEFDRNTDFTKYRAFAITDAKLNRRKPSLNSELVRKRLDDDIQKYLTAKNLGVTSGPSDLNVRYTLGTARKAETEAYPAAW
jgi:hypothetical protein